jgi:hypothetical protein
MRGVKLGSEEQRRFQHCYLIEMYNVGCGSIATDPFSASADECRLLHQSRPIFAAKLNDAKFQTRTLRLLFDLTKAAINCENATTRRRLTPDHGEVQTSAANAMMSAGGMTTMPSFRNCHAVTASPSRLRAVNQRIVASDPVTERLGPRSTPINIPLVT